MPAGAACLPGCPIRRCLRAWPLSFSRPRFEPPGTPHDARLREAPVSPAAPPAPQPSAPAIPGGAGVRRFPGGAWRFPFCRMPGRCSARQRPRRNRASARYPRAWTKPACRAKRRRSWGHPCRQFRAASGPSIPRSPPSPFWRKPGRFFRIRLRRRGLSPCSNRLTPGPSPRP